MSTKRADQPCTTPNECGFVAERNRYFTGKYMTARDFQADQTYFLSRHRLHNRVFHGQGIVCGLEVVPHRKEDCKDRWVVVNPGIAIDCCGRELVIHEKTPVKIWDPPDDEKDNGSTDGSTDGSTRSSTRQDTGGQTQKQSAPAEKGQYESEGQEEEEEAKRFLLYLRYQETPVENVPALYAEGQCDPTEQEANRVREEACLVACPWPKEEEEDKRRCRDDCADSLPGPGGSCLEPECPKDQMVPLALIRPRDTGSGYVIGSKEIDTSVRHQLRPPPEFLTHIVDYNWPHGGEVTISELERSVDEGGLGGRLEVYFDRKLLGHEPENEKEEEQASQNGQDGVGINQYTFVVQFSGAQLDLEYLPHEPDAPPQIEMTEEYCRAVFTIRSDFLRGRSAIIGETVHITLKCDFILDCRGQPVDGDHLGGAPPTGNGIAGGIFESWFHVISDQPPYREAS